MSEAVLDLLCYQIFDAEVVVDSQPTFQEGRLPSTSIQ
jgi:hypothetical protein